jgi:head-tail adaptor
MSEQPIILREIVRIEKLRPTAVSDAGGHVDATVEANWIEHCTRRAQVIGMGVREVPSPDGQEMKAQEVMRVKLRWDAIAAATRAKMRVQWLSAAGAPRRLNIVGCYDPAGERRTLVLDCLAPTA